MNVESCNIHDKSEALQGCRFLSYITLSISTALKTLTLKVHFTDSNDRSRT